jgi:lincosamide nucleotidyltransferase
VGEALSCLLVGLQRWHRGEKLSAARFVQGHALDRLLELQALRDSAAAAGADPFNRERRLETRHPALAAELPALVPGYAHTPQAALAMLQALAQRGAVLAPAITERIQALALG